ncbi:MAG: hypothetical protein JO074_07120 [Frankiales bacterium]|nr:hypothetical protein [Frankiales bacterium]
MALLVGGGLAFAPSSASATQLCEMVGYNGVTTVMVGPDCIPYNGVPDCSGGTLSLGVLGNVPHEVCLPAL